MDARTESRTYSFIALSTVTHVALAIGVLALNIQNEPKEELTQIEILTAGRSIPVPVSEAPRIAPIPKAAPSQAIPVAKEAAAPAIKQQPATKLASSTPAAPKAAPVEPVAAVLPEIENTDLESPVVVVASELRDEDINEDLSKIDAESSQTAMAVQEELQQETEREMKEQEAKLLAIQKQNEETSQKLAQEQAERRAQEKAALRAAKAQAARDAELARQAQAARLAEQARIQAQKEAAAAAALTAQKGQGGSAQAQNDGVRALEDLRQLPGNQRPQYDSQDRLYKRQGEVAFLAYVSREGHIVDYKMMKSSGHRELDAKTLKAIKNWKFYPGQEGWVEIPFKWDLKGGPQEMPTTLRRRAQVSQNSQ